ncbi:MAG: peptide-methionine (S)-S-oxide reductase [Aurantibacter sp.]
MSHLKIALGGGCHWCTEAVFQSLKGISQVEQGFVASTGKNNFFSEAIIVHFDPNLISLKVLIEIHLHTHKSTSNHSMREKYRSAIYVFSNAQFTQASRILSNLQSSFEKKIITKVYHFDKFKPSGEQFVDYYYRDQSKPFCQTYIGPKLSLLIEKFSDHTNIEKILS